MKRIYSYIEVGSETLRPPVMNGPDSAAPIFLATIDGRHYVAVTGELPRQSPAIELAGPLDLAKHPELRRELERRAEPLVQVRRQRAEKYPEIGELLDALMKEFAARRQRGESLSAELSALVDRCLAVKTAHPKPDIGLE